MKLFKLKQNPLESAKLIVLRETRAWIGKHHADPIPGIHRCNGKLLVFSPIALQNGDELEIDGQREIWKQSAGQWYPLRLRDVGINIQRIQTLLPQASESDIAKIAPFHFLDIHGDLRVREITPAESKTPGKTRGIPKAKFKELLERAEVFPSPHSANEWHWSGF